jgi:RNA polymerase sigma factor (sigma-70 family)
MTDFAEISRLPEAEIWKRYKRGDGQAFAYMFHAYSGMLYNYGMKIQPDKERIRDCIQDLFVDLWLYRQTVAETDSIKYYLFKSLRRKIVNTIRTENLHVHPDEWMLDEDNISSPSPEFSLIAEQSLQERRDKVQSLLHTLTRRQREAIFLKFYNELSYEEIASIMAISSQAVYNLISKGIKELKNHLPLKSFILFMLSLLQ